MCCASALVQECPKRESNMLWTSTVSRSVLAEGVHYITPRMVTASVLEPAPKLCSRSQRGPGLLECFHSSELWGLCASYFTISSLPWWMRYLTLKVRRLMLVIQHRYEMLSKDNWQVRFGTTLRLVRVLLLNTVQFQASWFLLHFQNQEGF